LTPASSVFDAIPQCALVAALRVVCLAREAGVAEPALETRGTLTWDFTLRTQERFEAATPLSVMRLLGAAASEDRRLCVAVFRRVCPYSTGDSVLEAGRIKYRAGPHGSAANAGKKLEADQ
jgi:hypothetical protein